MKNPIYASTTYLRGNETDVISAIEGLASLGLDGIELGSTHSVVQRIDLGKKIRSIWTGPIITHNYFPAAEGGLVINLASADESIRKASIAHAKYCLRVAAEIGAPIYTVHPGFVNEVLGPSLEGAEHYDFRFMASESPRLPAFERMLSSLDALVIEAQQVGVTLAIETEGSITNPAAAVIETPEDFNRLFLNFGKSIKLNFNLAHTIFASKLHNFDVRDFIASYRKYFVVCELSHNDGKADQHRVIEDGSWVLDWLNFLPSEVPLVLEFRDTNPDLVRSSLELVRVS